MKKLKAITMQQLKMFNATRKPSLVCTTVGHKFRPIPKMMPIRQPSGLRHFEVEGCVRCKVVKVLGAR